MRQAERRGEPTTTHIWISLGSLLAGLGVVTGAFAAHWLKNRVDSYSLDVFEKAVFYQLIHGVSILLVAALGSSSALSEKLVRSVCTVFVLGTLFFSGSLILLALTGQKWLGAITPIGGSLFIIGWFLLAFGVLKK